jgi:hypothetical protein
MRKVISGQVLDTQTATLVAAVQNDGTDDGQHLYQTQGGTFFVYSFAPALEWEFDDQGPTYQTNGVSEEVTPFSADAPVVRALLQRVARAAATGRAPLLP